MTTGLVIAHEKIADALTEKLVAKAKHLPVGDPTSGQVALGPVISRSQVDRIHGIVKDTVAAGAKLNAGGTFDGPFYRPTVLSGVKPGMLEVYGLSHAYGRHKALDQVSIRLHAGEAVAILGANGAGKTTLLNSIAGLVRPTAGSIRFEGRELVGLSPHRIVEMGIATVPENRRLFEPMSVIENLKLGAYVDRARDGAPAALDRVFTLFPRLAERRRQTVRTMPVVAPSSVLPDRKDEYYKGEEDWLEAVTAAMRTEYRMPRLRGSHVALLASLPLQRRRMKADETEDLRPK